MVLCLACLLLLSMAACGAPEENENNVASVDTFVNDEDSVNKTVKKNSLFIDIEDVDTFEKDVLKNDLPATQNATPFAIEMKENQEEIKEDA